MRSQSNNIPPQNPLMLSHRDRRQNIQNFDRALAKTLASQKSAQPLALD
jgi:hypothetical protein